MFGYQKIKISQIIGVIFFGVLVLYSATNGFGALTAVLAFAIFYTLYKIFVLLLRLAQQSLIWMWKRC